MVNEERRPQTPMFALVQTGISGTSDPVRPPAGARRRPFLFRFAEDGADAGDTWHESIADAMHQAEVEFGIGRESWRPVPTDVDPQAHIIALIRRKPETGDQSTVRWAATS
jgi:hypothetical protein